MIKISVCDDSPEFLQKTVDMINVWSKQKEIPVEIYCFNNGDELIKKISVLHMDIIFLDIIMPLLNGLDTAKEIRKTDKAVKLIFLTSSPDFALESYDVRAYHYLIKPVSPEKLYNTLDEAVNNFNEEPQSIVLKTSFGYQKLYFHDIEYAEAQNKKVVFYMRSGNPAEVTEPLYSFEDKLTRQNGFFKCHRSYIVYLPNVDHFSINSVVTKSGLSIPIARGYGKAFQEAYFSEMFKNR